MCGMVWPVPCWIPGPWARVQEVQGHFGMTKSAQLSPCVRFQFPGACEEICGNQVFTVHGRLAKLDSSLWHQQIPASVTLHFCVCGLLFSHLLDSKKGLSFMCFSQELDALRWEWSR